MPIRTKVGRCALLIALLMARGCAWALEQPSSSLMDQHPAMIWIRSLRGKAVNTSWFQADTCMGAFAAQTVKPTKLYGNRSFILALARSRKGVHGDSSSVCHTVLDSTGQKRTSGADGLKQTQAYTDEFGKAVYESFHALPDYPDIPVAEGGDDGPYEVPATVWDTAELEPVLSFCMA